MVGGCLLILVLIGVATAWWVPVVFVLAAAAILVPRISRLSSGGGEKVRTDTPEDSMI